MATMMQTAAQRLRHFAGRLSELRRLCSLRFPSPPEALGPIHDAMIESAMELERLRAGGVPPASADVIRAAYQGTPGVADPLHRYGYEGVFTKGWRACEASGYAPGLRKDLLADLVDAIDSERDTICFHGEATVCLVCVSRRVAAALCIDEN
jgi:hypothetical protein